MIDQKIEEMLPKAGWSMYTLVRMAAVRALELSEGKKNFVDAPSSAKITTVALSEIVEGKVVAKASKDMLAKPEEAKPEEEEA